MCYWNVTGSNSSCISITKNAKEGFEDYSVLDALGFLKNNNDILSENNNIENIDLNKN